MKKNYPTPHIKAGISDFAETVLMPGDPKRAKFIADNFLENPCLINNVRFVHGYTGTYKNKKISVMASGMGIPSIAIYSYELFNFFGVQNIIRVGSTGSLTSDLHLNDLVFVLGSSTDSNYGNQFGIGTFSATASFSLLQKAVKTAEKLNINYHVGNAFSGDSFYNADPSLNDRLRKMGIICVEMESYALYANAARSGKNALTMLSVSDIISTGEELSSDERETSFVNMIKTALELSIF